MDFWVQRLGAFDPWNWRVEPFAGYKSDWTSWRTVRGRFFRVSVGVFLCFGDWFRINKYGCGLEKKFNKTWPRLGKRQNIPMNCTKYTGLFLLTPIIRVYVDVCYASVTFVFTAKPPLSTRCPVASKLRFAGTAKEPRERDEQPCCFGSSKSPSKGRWFWQSGAWCPWLPVVTVVAQVKYTSIDYNRYNGLQLFC